MCAKEDMLKRAKITLSNSKTMEGTQMAKDRRMDKSIMVQSLNGILRSPENKAMATHFNPVLRHVK